MSPEQILGDAVVDGRADQYALGVLLFECLTGHMPFEGLSDVELLRKHLEQPIPDPRIFEPEMPSAVADVILRAMAKKPFERFLDVEQLLPELEKVAAGNGTRPTTSGSRWLAKVLGLGVAGALALAFGQKLLAEKPTPIVLASAAASHR